MFTPGSLVLVLIFLIPILAILVGGLKEVLKFKAKQNEIGSSTHDLERQLNTLAERLESVEAERNALQSRLQNLETIVTAEAWDALQRVQDGDDAALPDASDLDAVSLNDTRDATAADDVETLARQLRNR